MRGYCKVTSLVAFKIIVWLLHDDSGSKQYLTHTISKPWPYSHLILVLAYSWGQIKFNKHNNPRYFLRSHPTTMCLCLYDQLLLVAWMCHNWSHVVCIRVNCLAVSPEFADGWALSSNYWWLVSHLILAEWCNCQLYFTHLMHCHIFDVTWHILMLTPTSGK